MKGCTYERRKFYRQKFARRAEIGAFISIGFLVGAVVMTLIMGGK